MILKKAMNQEYKRGAYVDENGKVKISLQR